MYPVKYFQSAFKSTLWFLNGLPSTNFTFNSGSSLDDGIIFKANSKSVPNSVIDTLKDMNIFSNKNYIMPVLECLTNLNKLSIQHELGLSAQISQETSYVSIANDCRQVDDFRELSFARIMISTKGSKIAYRDIALEENPKETIKNLKTKYESILIEIDNYKNSLFNVTPQLTEVVFPPGIGGYFIHEVFGHMLEGDYVSIGKSLFGSKVNLGEKIGPEYLNIIDDPTKYSKSIDLSIIDDEGEKLKKIDLVANGHLNGYICDKKTSNLLGDERFSGCARRQSYRYKSIPRMRSTFVDCNNFGDNLTDTIKKTENGFIPKQLIFGQVDLLSGNFMLFCNRGYMIKDGVLSEPVNDLIISGNVLKMLNSIKVIGNDFKILQGQCIKANQVIPVYVGSPTIKVNDLMIGGINNV